MRSFPGHRFGSLAGRVAAQAQPIQIAFLTFAAYYLGARLGLALTVLPNPIAVIWPPNAILFAALLLLPRGRWPLVVLSALPAHLLAQLQSAVPLGMVLCWFVSNIAEALVGATCVRWLVRRAQPSSEVLSVVAFIISALVASLLSSFLDSAFVVLNGWGARTYWELWQTRIFANFTTAITLVPLIVSWASGGFSSLRLSDPWRWIEAVALIVLLAVAATIAFDPRVTSGDTGLVYLPLPLLLWAALRFGAVGASTAFASVVFAVIWATGHSLGPFGAEASEEKARGVELFVICVAPTLLCLAALLQERRHIDELRQRLARASHLTVMGEIAASIAHEINQPMSAILSNVDAAEMLVGDDSSHSRELREILSDIRNDDLRASEVIRHIRGFVNKQQAESERLELNDLIEGVVRLVAPTAQRRRMTISCALGDIPPARGSRIQLQQVLLNLMLNGMDAMAAVPEDRRILRVATARAGREAIEVSVADKGQGIAAHDRDRIFDSFYTTKADGMGLGLSIARSLVEAQGGKIWVEGKATKGATLCFTIPVDEQDNATKNRGDSA